MYYEAVSPYLGVLTWAAGAWSFCPWPFNRRVSETQGSARYSTKKEIGKSFTGGGVIVGKYQGKLLRFDDAGHLVTFAPTRTGKGRGQIIPTLLTYEGSCFVTDIKRENYDITARQRRALGQAVYAIDPNRPETSAIFNPLDYVRVDPQHLGTDASTLAGLLVPRGNAGASAHFDQQAYTVVKGLIMLVKTIYGVEKAHMGTVRALLCSGEEQQEEVWQRMAASSHAEIAEIGNGIVATEIRERSAILSTARGKTEIWSDNKIKTITSGASSFDFHAMKEKPQTVYMVIPPEHLDTYKSFMRAVVGMANLAMTQNTKRPKKPVLFLLDEFPALGHMAAFETGIGVVAGYGVKYWLFCQDQAQLKAKYKDAWASMVGNCAVQSYFGVTDYETAKRLSNSMGNQTVSYESVNASIEAGGLMADDRGFSVSERGRELMTPDEITSMDYQEQIILKQGMRPIRAQKAFYDQVKQFRGLYDTWEE